MWSIYDASFQAMSAVSLKSPLDALFVRMEAKGTSLKAYFQVFVDYIST